MTDASIECLERPAPSPLVAGRKRLGLIALATDLTTEVDLAAIIPLDRAGIYATRVAYRNPTTVDNLRKMTPALKTAAELLLPGIQLDAIYYGCTAASVVIGDGEVASAINQARPGVPVVTPTLAARHALAVLDLKRIAVLTPYTVETSTPMAEYFVSHGFEVRRFACFGMDDDREMALICQNSIIEAVLQLDGADVEGFFISCTALPAIGTIDALERRTGKPVITSNQASAWLTMRHAGLDDRVRGYGRLFDLDWSSDTTGAAA